MGEQAGREGAVRHRRHPPIHSARYRARRYLCRTPADVQRRWLPAVRRAAPAAKHSAQAGAGRSEGAPSPSPSVSRGGRRVCMPHIPESICGQIVSTFFSKNAFRSLSSSNLRVFFQEAGIWKGVRRGDGILVGILQRAESGYGFSKRVQITNYPLY